MNATLRVPSSDIILHDSISRRRGSLRPVALEGESKRFLEQTQRACQEISVPVSTTEADNQSGKYCGFYKKASSHEEKVAMYARAAELPNLLVTWILVADNLKAQIYECYKTTQTKLKEAGQQHYYDEPSGQTLAPLPGGFIKEKSIWDCRMNHDWNRTDSSDELTRNIDELRRAIRAELHRQFLGTITSKLQQAYATNSFDRLIFSVPARMISELKDRLAFDVQDCIVAAHGF